MNNAIQVWLVNGIGCCDVTSSFYGSSRKWSISIVRYCRLWLTHLCHV